MLEILLASRIFGASRLALAQRHLRLRVLGLPAEFVSWVTLNNLKANLALQPRSNPHKVKGILSFAGFLIEQIEQFYPGKLG